MNEEIIQKEYEMNSARIQHEFKTPDIFKCLESNHWHWDRLFPDTPRMKSRDGKTPPNCMMQADLLVALGANGTGIPFHYHTEAWLELLHGRKWWFLYPPSASVPFRSLSSHSDWVDTYRHRDFADHEHVMECVQEPGDVF